MENNEKHGLFRRLLAFDKRKFLDATRRIAIFAAICLLLQSLLVALSSFHPFLEVANHFLMHGIVASIIVLPVLATFRVLATAVFPTMSTISMLLYSQPWQAYVSPQAQPTAAQTRQLKVLSWNVQANNQQLEEVNVVLEDSDADLVVLIETRPGFLESLPILAE